LLVDPETPESRELIAFLRSRGFRVFWARNGEGAFNVLDTEHVDCLVCELRMERIDGLAILRRSLKRHPGLCAVMMTEGGAVETAVEAMREGAFDFQTKPLNLEKLAATLRHGLSHQALAGRVAHLESRLDERFGFERFTGKSRVVQQLIDQTRQAAATRATVLISGESGSGKGLVAQALHQNSPRSKERFVRVNCAVLAEDEVESELFGRERPVAGGGAERRKGRLEIGDGGTLFLDAVSGVSLAVQEQLLRVLQGDEFERVGGEEAYRVDVRVVASTDRDLEDLVERKAFREDLYQLLHAVNIRVPPLRERQEDIPLLVEEFIREFNRAHARKVTGISRAALERLQAYEWPANVRELKNSIEGMVVFAESKRPLSVTDLPVALRDSQTEPSREVRLDLGQSMEEVEKRFIAETLRWVGYDKPRAAETLGISLRTLYRKLKEYEIV
jgi:DNA-binding NtrC family response regulator